MPLITPTEISSIAFLNALDPALILPLFISSAETKYIVPLVTQPVLNQIESSPANYTVLINDYIKPYLAFAVKYMLYNQLLTETNSFPPEEQRYAALQEVLNIMEVNRERLRIYLNTDIFTLPVSTSNKLISGFRVTN